MDVFSIVYLVDFGLAKKYMFTPDTNTKQKQHIANGKATNLVGTRRYLSESVLQGNVPCRKDDCISLLYLLSYLFQVLVPL